MTAVEDTPHSAIDSIFADRADLARRFVAILSTTGVQRGLLGPREADRIWSRHVLNCAVIGELIGPNLRVVDVGSGAGLPGVALSIARPDLTVDLVEPLLRRSTFLEEVVAELEVNARVIRGRAESTIVRSRAGGADVVVSRAVAPLATLAGWCVPLARSGGAILSIKGSSAGEELRRDGEIVMRQGVVEAELVQCGIGLVDPPTTVIRLRRSGPR